MKIRLLLLLPALLLVGCSAAVRTPLLDVNVGTGSRLLGLNSGVRVIYPYMPTGDTSLSKRYGPEWQNIQGSYPEYKFN